MPIHDVGFRSWTGVKAPRIHGWWVMLLTNIMILRRNSWLRRALAAAWLPTLYIGAGFYMLETTLHSKDTEMQRAFFGMFRSMLPLEIVASMTESTLTPELVSQLRHRTWGLMISTFLAYPQALAAMIMIGMIAPGLISRDLRTRAYLIYFSKPIGTWEYLLGKYLTVIAFVSLITVVPAVALYLFGVGFSPDLGVVWDTWDLPLRTVVAAAVFFIPTTTVALAFSSLTQESRYAAIGWFVFWILGFAAWQIVYAARLQFFIRESHLLRMGDELGYENIPFGGVAQQVLQQQAAEQAADSMWSLLSLYESIKRVQQWVLGAADQLPLMHAVVLGAVTLAAFAILVRRVNAPLRV